MNFVKYNLFSKLIIGTYNCVSFVLYAGSLMVIISLLTMILVPTITKWHAILAITVNITLGDLAYSGGFYPTLLNLAPNYAGLLSGVSTFISFLVACPSTVVNSIILKQVRIIMLCV